MESPPAFSIQTFFAHLRFEISEKYWSNLPKNLKAQKRRSRKLPLFCFGSKQGRFPNYLVLGVSFALSASAFASAFTVLSAAAALSLLASALGAGASTLTFASAVTAGASLAGVAEDESAANAAEEQNPVAIAIARSLLRM
ncbi:MAG: hypothetical protein IT343_18630 [Candidatus Melainabacteria bacterium]|nr:hypothetical protein [Candidatus Melainabacteria bacterium]